VVRCIKKQVADAEIHYITKEQFYPVIKANPYIDKIHVIRKHVSEVIQDLKAEDYDYIVDLHKNFRSRQICLFLKSRCSTFNKINFRKWLIVNFKINRLPEIHIVDRYFKAVEHLGVTNDQLGLDYFIPSGDQPGPSELPARYRQNYIAWVIGGKHNTKIYPEKRIIEICKKINRPVVLIGGPEDVDKGARIEHASGNHVYNACGKFNLNQSATLVKNSSLVLTNDTGLMHAAAAFKKPIISFWGNTIPGFGMFPYLPGEQMKSHLLEVDGLSCRPCSKLGFKSCPKQHFRCMMDIDAEEVVRLVNGSSRFKDEGSRLKR
jgi:ADP-heptose:LPS heptosyltransferase